MVARLQQVTVFAWVLLATGWLVFWWPRGAAWAWGGIIALVLIHTGVLAIEFIANYVVNQSGVAPRSSTRGYFSAWLAESCLAPRVFFWRQPFRWRALPDRLPRNGRRGVVLIHGFLCNRGFWIPWLRELQRRDRAYIALSLEPVFGSIDNYAQAIDAAIDRIASVTGHAPLLVCHSMGGLAARAWLRDADASRVHRIVTIGTPHDGTWLARFGLSANGRQMRPGAQWLAQIAGKPGRVHQVAFTCWYSNCDNMIFHTATATLPGADNRLAAGLAHVQMAFDRRVMQETLSMLDA